MTTLTTTDWLARGVIASMMDTDTALIETVSVDGKLMTVAFVSGMPMPYETFSMLMLYRMAPSSVAQIYQRQGLAIQANTGPLTYVPEAPSSVLPPIHQQRLGDLVQSQKRVPERYRLIEGFDKAAWDAVDKLFTRIGNSSTDPKAAHDNFTAMMMRIEESYASSLLDPQIMSVETFNFNDDGLIANQF